MSKLVQGLSYAKASFVPARCIHLGILSLTVKKARKLYLTVISLKGYRCLDTIYITKQSEFIARIIVIMLVLQFYGL